MKILIGLIEHFGDIVACEPVARYLIQQYPGAHLSWAVLKPYRELIDTNPHIDETVILGCLTDWIKLAKHSEYDLTVDLHVNYRVCEQCRVPLIKSKGNPFVNAYEWFDYGAILEAFSQGAGLPKLSAQPRVYLKEEHKTAVDALQLPSQYCVIHRESNSPEKSWPGEKWQGLVRFLAEDLKLPVVEVGSKQKSGHANGNRAAAADSVVWHSPVIDLVDRTSLLETAEVIRRARVYVGIDSGPAHLANAVQTPGIVLLGRIGFFRQYTPFTGFYASSSPLVRLVRNMTGMVGELPLDEVLAAARYLMGILDERDRQGREGAPTPASIAPIPLNTGYRRVVLASGFFDRAWYVTHHPEAIQNGCEPLDHFITVGAQSGHSPGPAFDAAWYKTQRSDLAAVADPLQHYLIFGQREELRTCPTASATEVAPANGHGHLTLAFSSTEPEVEETPIESAGPPPRIFAFYLPQFHPIAENNYGHRPGFTEWDNVIKAQPLFRGHYQPRIPGELGYYDLRSIDVMREQVALANSHGIDGFCFYYYYFQGKKLLFKPIENYIKSDIEAPFCLLWANENWTRRWDGGDHELIVAQNHSPQDDLLFIRDLFAVFSDERYVKVQGKPLLGIYKTHLFPNILQSTELWRNEAVKNGFPGLYLVMVDDWTGDPKHPRMLGFDASYEIPSNLIPQQVLCQETEHLGLKHGFQGQIVDYYKFASYHMGRPFPDYKRFRTVMAPWDNTPRYGSRAMVQINADNDAYKLWLSQALVDTHWRYAPDERIVFLHSWNEWCEGTYLEPDGRYGRRRLEETREVVHELRDILSMRCDADRRNALLFGRLMKAKDEGATRSIQALRQQNMDLSRQLLHQRADNLTIDNIVTSKSWALTKPLRAVGRILRKP